VLRSLLSALCLMALCVVIHASGVAWAIRQVKRRVQKTPSFWHGVRLFILVAAWIVLLHLLEISVWGVFYVGEAAMADLPSSLYFSAVTYTTTGYGDLVLPPPWRLVGGVEALTGILMCGWSTGFFVTLVSRLYEPQGQAMNA
jgi:hypothetical protein